MKHNSVFYFQKNDDGWHIQLFNCLLLWYVESHFMILMSYKSGVENSGKRVFGIKKQHFLHGGPITYLIHSWGLLKLKEM